LKILEQQDTGTCTKTVKIEVPCEDISSELDGVYKEFVEHAVVPGFRKGKAPRHIVKMKFGKHLEDEARGKTVENAFKKAMEELNLKPVSSPEFSDIDEDKKDEPIIFEAKFEYSPEIELAEYKGIQPELPPNEVTEKEVVDTLTRLRENQAMFKTIDDRPAAEKDFVMVKSSATIDGEPFAEATHDEIVIEIGSKRYLPGLEDALIGLNVGDKKEVTITLPDDYPTEENRGKETLFDLELKQIREKALPELDDEFAKDMGNFESLDDLKERIREDLGRSLEDRRKQELRNGIREELLKRNTFDIPQSMVKARYNYINALHDMELRRSSTTLEAEAAKDESILTRNEETADREVRVSLILNQIAEKESIEVDDNDYNAYIGALAAQSDHDAAQYAKRIESQGIESYYRREALEEKVLDYLQDMSELSMESSTPETAEDSSSEDKTEE
jgi:trigger factor